MSIQSVNKLHVSLHKTTCKHEHMGLDNSQPVPQQ